MKEPFVTIKNVVKQLLKNMKEVLVKFRKMMIHVKHLIVKMCKYIILQILNNPILTESPAVMTIRKAFEFLGNVVSICNRSIGTPFERCSKMFEEANESCK